MAIEEYILSFTAEEIDQRLQMVSNISDQLNSYYKQNETYSKAQIDNLLNGKFDIAIVPTLPSIEINSATLYLLDGGNGTCAPYIFVPEAGAPALSPNVYEDETYGSYIMLVGGMQSNDMQEMIDAKLDEFSNQINNRVETLEACILNIDYENILSFDTTEIVVGVSNSVTTSILGKAILGQMILG